MTYTTMLYSAGLKQTLLRWGIPSQYIMVSFNENQKFQNMEVALFSSGRTGGTLFFSCLHLEVQGRLLQRYETLLILRGALR